MHFEQLTFNRSFVGLDLGEGKNHIMARVYGLKKDRIAKCKSCTNYQNDTCSMLTEGFVCKENVACRRYQSKKTIKK